MSSRGAVGALSSHCTQTTVPTPIIFRKKEKSVQHIFF